MKCRLEILIVKDGKMYRENFAISEEQARDIANNFEWPKGGFEKAVTMPENYVKIWTIGYTDNPKDTIINGK